MAFLLPPTAAPPALGGGKGNLPGIVDGMVTFNMGVTAQVAWDLDHKPLCKPECPGYKSKRKCPASCEQGIIRAAKKARKK